MRTFKLFLLTIIAIISAYPAYAVRYGQVIRNEQMKIDYIHWIFEATGPAQLAAPINRQIDLTGHPEIKENAFLVDTADTAITIYPEYQNLAVQGVFHYSISSYTMVASQTMITSEVVSIGETLDASGTIISTYTTKIVLVPIPIQVLKFQILEEDRTHTILNCDDFFKNIMTDEQIINEINHKIKNLITKIEPIISCYRDEIDLGASTTLSIGSYTELLQYRQALRGYLTTVTNLRNPPALPARPAFLDQ